MLGLFGTLNLGARSLQTQQQGIEVAGQNLANVNNAAYARQRVALQTSVTINGQIGPQGTGAEAVAIVQIRSGLLDDQIQAETSVRGSLEAQQLALQYAEANLGTQIDRVASGSDTASVSGAHNLAGGLSDLFNSFQSVSANPTSMTERESLLMNAVTLTTQFQQVDQRLGNLTASLNESVETDVGSANQLLADIAKLNDQIGIAEASSNGVANDLRDLRQQKIEALAKVVKIDVATGAQGSADISIAGTTMVSGNEVAETLQTYDAGGGQILVRAASTATPLTLTGGSLQGTIDARDGAVASLRTSINSLAAQLISEVNVIHAAGFSLTGSTGENFFTGTNAADMQVNSTLLNDPSLFQAAGVAGGTGENQVALALAQLAGKKLPALNGQTLSQGYSQTVAALGQSLASVNTQLSDQEVVEKMLTQQRSSVSGVSLDEEMTDLTKFQRAYQASAKLISIVDEMLDTVVNM
ncbi:MAG: flagellar hook-associated protein FlgK [Verrucomicrobiota bacterium]|nr:flagellar hook-associated protein FlgK [Verrucomicrobiota bacterium]MCC6820280.1 flagellar hook-associated protein FlgK [Limisphaerales bacterium]